MGWKDEFYQAIKRYAKLPEEAEVVDIEEYAGPYYGGCDTCGHGSGQDFEVWITYNLNDSRKSATVEGKLGDFINSL